MKRLNFNQIKKNNKKSGKNLIGGVKQLNEGLYSEETQHFSSPHQLRCANLMES